MTIPPAQICVDKKEAVEILHGGRIEALNPPVRAYFLEQFKKIPDCGRLWKDLRLFPHRVVSCNFSRFLAIATGKNATNTASEGRRYCFP